LTRLPGCQKKPFSIHGTDGRKKTIRRRMVVRSSKKSATPLHEAAVTQFQIPIPLPPLA